LALSLGNNKENLDQYYDTQQFEHKTRGRGRCIWTFLAITN